MRLTHLNLLISRCCWDTQERNLLIRLTVSVKLSKAPMRETSFRSKTHCGTFSFPPRFTHGRERVEQSEGAVECLPLKTFDLQTGGSFLGDGFESDSGFCVCVCACVCGKLVGGQCLTSLGLQAQQRFKGMQKNWGGWATTDTYTQLVGTRRGMLATLLSLLLILTILRSLS